ncbi:MAG TPA: hypothetical protein PL009_01440 [Flavipsychrobacter sp.]|nr:hypothetical protein [Flavipsychrobacter sp.]
MNLILSGGNTRQHERWKKRKCDEDLRFCDEEIGTSDEKGALAVL